VECGDLSPLCSLPMLQSGDKSPHSTGCRLPYIHSQFNLNQISPAKIAGAWVALLFIWVTVADAASLHSKPVQAAHPHSAIARSKSAQTFSVSTSDDLQAALQDAQPG